MATLAIDLDGTLDRDPQLWRMFIDLARQRGHRVVCVTGRQPTQDNIETVDAWLARNHLELAVFYSAYGSKVAYMESIGWKVDVWIDDDPLRCAKGF